MDFLPNRQNTCCFTGHRPEKLPWHTNEADERCIALKAKISDVLDALYCSGIRNYICGMARGCDMYFCEAVISFRKAHPDVTLEAAVPCPSQADRWADTQKRRYELLLSECDTVKYVRPRYTPDCMMARNRYMVDNSSVLLAVFDGTSGGTKKTVDYAAKKGLEIVSLMP